MTSVFPAWLANQEMLGKEQCTQRVGVSSQERTLPTNEPLEEGFRLPRPLVTIRQRPEAFNSGVRCPFPRKFAAVWHLLGGKAS